MGSNLDTFIKQLSNYSTSSTVFNPWRDVDEKYDLSKESPVMRANNLKRYLSTRIERAKYVVVAEALGWQGGKFSGIPMTSERMITGNHETISFSNIFPSQSPIERTSNGGVARYKTVKELGYTEPTATTVWNAFLNNAVAPVDFVLWNAFPFHPIANPDKPLSNRSGKKLTGAEKETGTEFLRTFISLFQVTQIIAIGNNSVEALQAINREPVLTTVHPARKMHKKFTTQIDRFFNEE